jgi:hypothetical protein
MASEAIQRLKALMGDEGLPLRSTRTSSGAVPHSEGSSKIADDQSTQEVSGARNLEIANSESSADTVDAKHTIYPDDAAAEDGEWRLSPLRELPGDFLHPETLTLGLDRSSELSPGDEAKPGEAFCPVQAVSKLPYRYIDKRYQGVVSEVFFTKGKFWEKDWDM